MSEKNTGLIEGFKESDWAGGTIPWENRNPSGDWLPFVPVFEKQYSTTMDTMACVSFSLLNSCEMQIKQQTGQEVNFSDRFLAKMSGTIPTGNWLHIVADALRHYGCVHEDEWPNPPNPDFNWNEYYSEIPDFIKARAKKQFSDKYELQYERFGIPGFAITIDEMKRQLQHAPLWATIPGHAITACIISVNNDEFTYLDTYPPFVRTKKITELTSVWKAVLTKKSMIERYRVNYKGKLGVALVQDGAFGAEVYFAKNADMLKNLHKDYEVPFDAPFLFNIN
jgi:hypothetical protein